MMKHRRMVLGIALLSAAAFSGQSTTAQEPPACGTFNDYNFAGHPFHVGGLVPTGGTLHGTNNNVSDLHVESLPKHALDTTIDEDFEEHDFCI